MKCAWLAVALVLVGALPSTAQVDAPTSYELRVYAAGASAPQITTPFPASAVQCGVVMTIPAGPQTNPTVVVWVDNVITGTYCRFDTTTSGVLVALPSGPYEGAVVAINAGGPGLESNRDPFLRQRPPAALTGVKFTR